jgi:hypothetical protein
MEEKFVGWRADARVFVQTFYALDDIHLKFVYLISRFLRYLPEPHLFQYHFCLAGDVPRPDADDYAGALHGNAAGRRALEEAAERGWIDQVEADPVQEDDEVLRQVDRVARSMPGKGAIAFRKTLVGRVYKQLVDRYLIELPRLPGPEPEPYLPTTTSAWEFGDDPRLIDWTQSVLASGSLAAALPVRRDLESDDPRESGVGIPRAEIYLDTSGSMPSPDQQVNAMTLAAQILSAAVLRKNGKVRAVIYSSGKPLVSDWMYDEEKAREFLLHYSGGGTQYPFGVLKKFADEGGDTVRVVISDSDFLWNLKERANALESLLYGIERSAVFVAFLALWDEKEARDELRAALGHPAFRLVAVQDLTEYAEAASRLARALFGDR